MNETYKTSPSRVMAVCWEMTHHTVWTLPGCQPQVTLWTGIWSSGRNWVVYQLQHLPKIQWWNLLTMPVGCCQTPVRVIQLATALPKQGIPSKPEYKYTFRREQKSQYNLYIKKDCQNIAFPFLFPPHVVVLWKISILKLKNENIFVAWNIRGLLVGLSC